MKLLLDQNVSFKLLSILSDILAGSAHVRELGMADADDGRIWNHALTEGYTIAS